MGIDSAMKSPDHSRARRALLLLADAGLVVAVLVATSPWTSGAYTWLAQRRLAAEVASPQAGASAAAARPSTSATRSATPVRGEDPDASRWRRAADGSGVGRLSIPKLGLDIVVVKGVRDADLRRGPGWLPWTSAPGSGNCGISGHRTTYLAPFRDIDRLAPGDPIDLTAATHRYRYRVTQRFFATPNELDIMLPTRAPTLTLTACHPPYSDRFRIVVQARLETAAPLGR